MLTKDDLEQIGRLLQAQNENTKQLIEASEENTKQLIEISEERIKREVKQAIKISQEQVLDTIAQTADGVIEEVKKDQEKEMKRLEQKIGFHTESCVKKNSSKEEDLSGYYRH